MNKIAKKAGTILTGISAAVVMTAGRVMAVGINAEEMENPAQEGADAARGNSMPSELIGDNGAFSNITNVILYIIGIISVIMLIYGGLRYVLSGGNKEKVTAAKNTIIYAIIGLIIAILSFAIINFVLGTLGSVTK